MTNQGSSEAVLARVSALDSRVTVIETTQTERRPVIDGRLEKLELVVPLIPVRLGGFEQSITVMTGQIKELREDYKTSVKEMREEQKTTVMAVQAMEACIRNLGRNGHVGRNGRLAQVAPMLTTGGVAGSIVSVVLVVLEMMR